MKPLDELGPEERAALAQITEQRSKSGTRLTVKLFDKQRALDALAKHLGLFTPGAAKPDEEETAEGKKAREDLRERILRLIEAAKKTPRTNPAV